MLKIEKIKELTQKLIELIWLEYNNIEVTCNDIEKNIFSIKIDTPDSSELIWFSWINLESFSILLKSILKNIFEESIKIHLEVNDYIQKKDTKLYIFIDKQIKILKDHWKDIILPKYNSYQRKKIHSYISELNDTSIITKSIWEWEDRRLHLLKISKNITIDMDGIWI